LFISFAKHRNKIVINENLEPSIITNTTIRFKPLKPIKSISLVRSGTSVKFKEKNGWVECLVPQIINFEMLVVFTGEFPWLLSSNDLVNR
jgi:hypothetical protein